jgi:hypothetical protein
MLIMRLRGGLGNQLFQYAATVGLVDRLGAEAYFDARDYNLPRNDGTRKYSLEKFDIPVRLLDGAGADRLLEGLSVYDDPDDGGREGYEAIEDGTYIYGYFMDERFFTKTFRNSPPRFREAPRGKNARLVESMAGQQSVSVHIRRGDYLQAQHGRYQNVCTDEYYRKGIEYIARNLNRPVFYFFSDDPRYVKKNFNIRYPYVVVSNNIRAKDAHEDLRLMASCKYNIVANSTFSWWGAYLNRFEGKVVVRPATYYCDRGIPEVFPRDWVVP